jgi:glycosyltransferase involved in cell wall biosynthesis
MKDPSQTETRVATLFPHYADAVGNSHTVLSVCGNMRGEGMDVRLVQPASDPGARKPFTRDAVPRLLKGLAYRFWSAESLNRYSESVFLRSLRAGEVAYLWPGVSLATYRRVKERGHTLVMERFNCHTGTAKRILDDAYARLGLPPKHNVSDAMVTEEREQFELCDYAFAPSPRVEESFRENGVPEAKILGCSYGWDPDRLQGTTRALPESDGLTVLFVGLQCVRKGIHLLFDAWARSGVKGRLVLAGPEAEEITTLCADHLNRPDVVRLGYVRGIEAVFRSADVFAFPTLEEGGPLVTYEAMACNLPVLVSPMGAGRIARHEQDGFVVDPYNRDGWIDALRRLAAEKDLRAALGQSARKRAEEFTWARAGSHRRRILWEALAKR